MNPRHSILAILTLVLAAAALPTHARQARTSTDPAPRPGPAGPPARNISYIRGIPDTSSYWLPDTTVLARVNARVIRTREYIATYYDSYAEDRPLSDSTGRVEWLNSMVNKEVVGTIARRANYSFGYEERLVMREHTQRVLSNMLFKQAVLDSLVVPGDEIRARYERLKTEYRLRHILLADRALAERARRDLAAGHITWKDAVAKYTIAKEEGPEGDLGWLSQAVDQDQPGIFSLAPGQISAVLDDPAGFQIVQLLERRPVEPAAWEGMRKVIRIQITKRQTRERSERLLAIMRVQSGIQYDDANIRWASSLFHPREARGPVEFSIRHDDVLPVVAPADTSRLLARWRDGRLSLGAFLKLYSDLPHLNRPEVNTPEGFRNQMDAFVLEPYKARMAVERGLDKDSLTLALIEKKREQLLVEHMYRDSIEAKVYVSPDRRRKYYKDHLADFMTHPSVRYVLLPRPDSVSAHALAARLRKGENAEAIQRRDSLAGVPSRLRVEPLNGHSPLHELLFEELKPGQVFVQGPDQKGQYLVIQSLVYDPGRQLSFAESDRYADENLHNLVAEELFKKFIARHRPKFRIESHPELVMRIRLVDPVALMD